MTEISLNELPKWSPWPGRLLGIDPWAVPSRTVAKVDREYDKDRYAKCLAFCQERGPDGTTPEDIKDYVFGGPNNTMCIALGDSLAVVSTAEADERYYPLFKATMGAAIAQAAVVVELGCGYGYNLWRLNRHFPDKTYVGGEYSANAVKLGGLLFKKYPNIRVQPFNFYEAPYALLAEYAGRGPMVVFTSHALEQLPTAAPVIEALASFRGPLQRVLHFEPVHEVHGDTLIGMLRRRYTEANDYNRDLLTLLRQRSDVRILSVEPNLIGFNPMNPTTIVQWEFIR